MHSTRGTAEGERSGSKHVTACHQDLVILSIVPSVWPGVAACRHSHRRQSACSQAWTPTREHLRACNFKHVHRLCTKSCVRARGGHRRATAVAAEPPNARSSVTDTPLRRPCHRRAILLAFLRSSPRAAPFCSFSSTKMLRLRKAWGTGTVDQHLYCDSLRA